MLRTFYFDLINIKTIINEHVFIKVYIIWFLPMVAYHINKLGLSIFHKLKFINANITS